MPMSGVEHNRLLYVSHVAVSYPTFIEHQPIIQQSFALKLVISLFFD